MDPEEIIKRFPEYEKGFYLSPFHISLLLLVYNNTGRLTERIMRTVQRRLLKGEGCCSSSDDDCTHHSHKHAPHDHHSDDSTDPSDFDDASEETELE